MPFKDKQAQRDYQRRWIRQKRLDAIEALGGQCTACGSKERLELDHIDPSKKTKRAMLELHLCQVLCYECHKKKTIEEATFDAATIERIKTSRGSSRAVAKALGVSHSTVLTYR